MTDTATCDARLAAANAARRCGARTRTGAPCRAPAVHGKARCRKHGGARGSGAQPGNRNAWKHGVYCTAAKNERAYYKRLFGGVLKTTEEMLRRLGVGEE